MAIALTGFFFNDTWVHNGPYYIDIIRYSFFFFFTKAYQFLNRLQQVIPKSLAFHIAKLRNNTIC